MNIISSDIESNFKPNNYWVIELFWRFGRVIEWGGIIICVMLWDVFEVCVCYIICGQYLRFRPVSGKQTLKPWEWYEKYVIIKYHESQKKYKVYTRNTVNQN